MGKKLDAHNIPLEKVFSSDFQLTIPRFQRPYAWSTEETIQLLEDLGEAMPNSEDPYFLGSVVLVNTDANQYDVIDGQQRLTTTTILMAVLRDLAAGPDPALADGIQGYLADTSKAWKAGATSTPRLTLRPQDAEFFRAWVQTPGKIAGLVALTDHAASSDSRKNIRDNASSLHDHLQAQAPESWSTLFDYLLERTELVVVSTEDVDSAHRIFSVLNARGLDLSPTDIFKSDLIGGLPHEKQELYADKWDKAEEAIGRQDFADLFRDIRTIVTKERARRELLKEFPERVLKPWLAAYTREQIIDDQLMPYADAFEKILNPTFGQGAEWETVNEWLRRLALIDNNDWRPVALWVLRHHMDDPKTLAALLRKVERLAAALLLRRVYATPRIVRYLVLLEQLQAGHGADAEAFDLSDEEKADARAGLDGNVYRDFQSRRLRYVMLRLDALVSNKPGVQYHHKYISVEHVLPQNPKEGSAWSSDFDADAREQWTHRLGNLLLLSSRKNSQAQNYDFTVKKAKYFDRTGSAVFALTTQVLQHDSWDPSVVESRHLDLTNRLVTEWELN